HVAEDEAGEEQAATEQHDGEQQHMGSIHARAGHVGEINDRSHTRQRERGDAELARMQQEIVAEQAPETRGDEDVRIHAEAPCARTARAAAVRVVTKPKSRPRSMRLSMCAWLARSTRWPSRPSSEYSASMGASYSSSMQRRVDKASSVSCSR